MTPIIIILIITQISEVEPYGQNSGLIFTPGVGLWWNFWDFFNWEDCCEIEEFIASHFWSSLIKLYGRLEL